MPTHRGVDEDDALGEAKSYCAEVENEVGASSEDRSGEDKKHDRRWNEE